MKAQEMSPCTSFPRLSCTPGVPGISTAAQKLNPQGLTSRCTPGWWEPQIEPEHCHLAGCIGRTRGARGGTHRAVAAPPVRTPGARVCQVPRQAGASLKVAPGRAEAAAAPAHRPPRAPGDAANCERSLREPRLAHRFPAPGRKWEPRRAWAAAGGRVKGGAGQEFFQWVETGAAAGARRAGAAAGLGPANFAAQRARAAGKGG